VIEYPQVTYSLHFPLKQLTTKTMLSQMLYEWVFQNDSFWNCLMSFCAGAFAVGFLWFYQNLPDELLVDNVSWIDPWNNVIKKSTWGDLDNWKRIGELPHEFFTKRRNHWPWETIRRSLSGRTVVVDLSADEKEKLIAEEEETEYYFADVCENEPQEAKQTCIGSIFGLDVGGTLAKLVYFEKKSADDDPVSMREQHYHVAASAQTVLMARLGQQHKSSHAVPRRRSFSYMETSRPTMTALQASRYGSHPTLHSELSEEDMRHLQELRQESVPDDLSHYRTSVHFKTPARPTGSSQSEEKQSQKENDEDPKSSSNMGNMKKSRSMFDLSEKQKKAEALDRFYNFARRLDSYQDSVRDNALSFYSRELGGEFHFIRYETRRMKNAMDLILVNNLHLNICEMGATGGGAHKYAADWERSLGIRMDKQDELDSLVAGMQFVLSTVVGECYTFRPKQTVRNMESSDSSEPGEAPILDETASEDSEEASSSREKHKKRVDGWWWSRKVQRDAISYSSAYPYLLVTIGTGVSILRVDGPRKHERISGSSIGGGTYWGLIRLLTDVEDFEDVMRLAEKGDPAKVDMMVGDIYGKDSKALEKLGLQSDIVASSFGKLVAKDDPASGLKQEDLARALLLMVTNNIGQVAYLNAQLHKTSRIYFVGNFLRSNIISQRRLSYAIDYWSKGEMEALFLEHEGYFGALGAFLISQNLPNKEEGSVERADGAKESSQSKDDRSS
jgi:type II pantothenate kinase